LKTKNILFISLFLGIIFSSVLLQTGIDFSFGERPQFLDLFLQKPTEANLRSYEKNMEDASWISKKLRPWMQYLQFLILRNPGEKALVGRENWMYYKPGVRYLIEPLPFSPDNINDKDNPISAIVSFRNQLTAHGIKLLLLPAPGKASVYPQMLTARMNSDRSPVNLHTREVINRLKEAGIEIVDLFEIFSNAGKEQSQETDTGYYLPRDTHWSPKGMHIAAKAAARKMLESGWIEKGKDTYDLKPVTINRFGDVIQMLNLPGIERFFTPNEVHCTQVVRSDNGELYKDSPNSEVLVLGDSFLRIYERDEPGSGGFIAHLAYELQSPLSSIVNDGGASTLVRQELSRKTELLKNKKVVIWEFVERDIRFGTEGWQEVPIEIAMNSKD